MNILEAIAVMRKGQKVRLLGWREDWNLTIHTHYGEEVFIDQEGHKTSMSVRECMSNDWQIYSKEDITTVVDETPREVSFRGRKCDLGCDHAVLENPSLAQHLCVLSTISPYRILKNERSPFCIGRFGTGEENELH